MNEETKVILKSIRWLIQRPTMREEFREPFNNTHTRQIDELPNPTNNKSAVEKEQERTKEFFEEEKNKEFVVSKTDAGVKE